MSTRSQIGFYEKGEKDFSKFRALLYRHSDGYPSGVLPDIIPFLIWWRKTRGTDIEYCSARLLQYICNEYDGSTKDFTKKLNWKKDEGPTGIYGHGICNTFHWDIAYFYKIMPEVVEVYKVPFGADEEPLKTWQKKWNKIITIDLNLNKEKIKALLENVK